jgi:hypothetical protein
MPNATTTPTTPTAPTSPTVPTTTPTTPDARQQHSGQPEREARRAAALYSVAVANPLNRPASVDNPAETSDDLADLADASQVLADQADRLGLRQSAAHARHMGKQLRATRTRLRAQPKHLASAQAYVETCAKQLADIAGRIGDSNHGGRPQ